VLLRAGPAAGDVNPFCKARSFLALHVDNVRVAPAPAANAVFFLLVPRLPVLVLLDPLLLVERRRLEVGLSGQLPRRRVGRTVLDRRVSVAKVAEVVNIARA
jgi:hypothetical protein